MVPPGELIHPQEEYVPAEDWWANPSIHEVAEAMRQVVRERGTQAEAARLDAGEQTADCYSWEDTALAFAEAFVTHLGELRERHTGTPVSRRDTVGVLVPCRNGQDDLERIGQTLRGAELWVCDDASETPLQVPLLGPTYAHLIHSNAWIGEGAARDRLLREADTEFVFMTDADVEFVDPSWADVLRTRLGNRRNVLLTPLMMLPDGRVWSAGGCYHVYGTQPLPAWHIGMGAHVDERTLKALDGQPCTYAPGAAWFARREDLLAVWDWIGGYYPTVFTDVDLCFWLRAHGWTIETCTATRLVHHCGSYTERQTDADASAERFREHSATFLSWWQDAIEDDLARGAVLM
jgi:GT2 family glycosyltransferase